MYVRLVGYACVRVLIEGVSIRNRMFRCGTISVAVSVAVVLSLRSSSRGNRSVCGGRRRRRRHRRLLLLLYS